MISRRLRTHAVEYNASLDVSFKPVVVCVSLKTVTGLLQHTIEDPTVYQDSVSPTQSGVVCGNCGQAETNVRVAIYSIVAINTI